MNSTTRMAIGCSAIDSYCEEYPQANSWMLLPAFILSFGLLIALHIKRKVRHREYRQNRTWKSELFFVIQIRTHCWDPGSRSAMNCLVSGGTFSINEQQ
jgi:hypothetical protein